MLPKTTLCMTTLFTSLNQAILQHKNETKQDGFKVKRLALLKLEKSLSNQVDCFCSMMHPTLPLIGLNRDKEERQIKQEKSDKKKAKQIKEQQLQKQKEKEQEIEQRKLGSLIDDEQRLTQKTNKRINTQKIEKIEDYNQGQKIEESEEITLESLVNQPENDEGKIIKAVKKSPPTKKRSKLEKKAAKIDNKIQNEYIDSDIYMSDSSESIKISVLREKNENGIDFESEDDEKHINRDIKIKKEDENAPMESS